MAHINNVLKTIFEKLSWINGLIRRLGLKRENVISGGRGGEIASDQRSREVGGVAGHKVPSAKDREFEPREKIGQFWTSPAILECCDQQR